MNWLSNSADTVPMAIPISARAVAPLKIRRRTFPRVAPTAMRISGLAHRKVSQSWNGTKLTNYAELDGYAVATIGEDHEGTAWAGENRHAIPVMLRPGPRGTAPNHCLL